jgi:predicted transcriptional regulator
MSTTTQARTRAETLKMLREAHADTVKRTQELLREQSKIEKQICQEIREKPKTVPEVASALNLPSHQVLWYLTALKKYGIVVENGMCGDYVLYQSAKEA